MLLLNDFIKEYFTECVDYPAEDQLCDDGVLDGVLYDYVSNTYLDGFINYLGKLTVFLLPDNTQAVTDIGIQELEEVFKGYNTKLYDIGYEILVLGETKKFFWILNYNPDNSDCAIGKFTKPFDRSRLEALLISLYDVVYLPYTPKGWVHW